MHIQSIKNFDPQTVVTNEQGVKTIDHGASALANLKAEVGFVDGDAQDAILLIRNKGSGIRQPSPKSPPADCIRENSGKNLAIFRD